MHVKHGRPGRCARTSLSLHPASSLGIDRDNGGARYRFPTRRSCTRSTPTGPGTAFFLFGALALALVSAHALIDGKKDSSSQEARTEHQSAAWAFSRAGNLLAAAASVAASGVRTECHYVVVLGAGTAVTSFPAVDRGRAPGGAGRRHRAWHLCATRGRARAASSPSLTAAYPSVKPCAMQRLAGSVAVYAWGASALFAVYSLGSDVAPRLSIRIGCRPFRRLPRQFTACGSAAPRPAGALH